MYNTKDDTHTNPNTEDTLDEIIISSSDSIDIFSSSLPVRTVLDTVEDGDVMIPSLLDLISPILVDKTNSSECDPPPQLTLV
jgi:hypothetical protein